MNGLESYSKELENQNNSNSGKLIEYHEVKPFTIVDRIETEEVMIVMGNDVIYHEKRKKDSVERLTKRIKKIDWELILNAATIYTNFINKEIINKNK